MGRPSRLPWVLLFLTLAAGAGLAYYSFERYRLQDTELETVKDELAAIKGDVGTAERDKLDLQRQLGRAEVDVKNNRERFTLDAEEADELEKKLAGIVGGDRSDVRLEGDDIVLQVSDSALFADGTASFHDEGREALEEIGLILVDMRERDVRVEAHTDDRPVAEVAKGFATNWDFAAARAARVVRFFQSETGIEPARLASISYAEFRPLSRTSPEKNRRVDIVLAPKSLQRVGE